MPYQYDDSLGRLTQMASKSLGHRLEALYQEAQLPYHAEHWTVLSYLNRYPKASQKQIAYFMGKDKASLKRLLDQMQNDDLINRTPSSIDRRFNEISLTAKGQHIYQKLVPIAEKVLDEATHNLSETTLAECQQTLELIISNLTR